MYTKLMCLSGSGEATNTADVKLKTFSHLHAARFRHMNAAIEGITYEQPKPDA
jgi:hypothetical protein